MVGKGSGPRRISVNNGVTTSSGIGASLGGVGGGAGTYITGAGTGSVTTTNGSATYVPSPVVADRRYYFECKSEQDQFANILTGVDDTDARVRRFDIDLLNSSIIVTFGYFRNAEAFITSLTGFNFIIENNWEDGDTDINTYSVERIESAKIEADRSSITECVVEFTYKEIN